MNLSDAASLITVPGTLKVLARAGAAGPWSPLKSPDSAVWDRAGMGTAVISELEARQLVYVNRKIGRMSSIGHSKYAVAVELRGHMKRVLGRVPRQVVRSDGGEADFRIGDRVMAVIRWGRLHRGVFSGCVSWMGAAVVISELEI